MLQKVKKYELAVKFKQAGYFNVAYPMFCECLEDRDLDYGNMLFECGWCVEHIEDVDNSLAVSYYLRAGKESADPLCRMNSFFRAGWLLMHFNRNEQAIEAFKNAIKIGHSEGNYESIYQEALYWCAVCLESENRFLDAIYLYRAVQDISTTLNPESRYREIKCLLSIGLLNEAFQSLDSFNDLPPKGFSTKRYNDLKNLVDDEKTLLIDCYSSTLNLQD
jgi:tetratricopeptide (TPR) repeat protein